MPARHTSIVDLHLILRRDHQILLGERMNTGFADGSYALPAGHLEAGEAATQGMAREAREETAILIEPSDLTLVHVMHHHTNSGRVALFFEATDWIGEVVNCEPAKCAGWTWHSLIRFLNALFPTLPRHCAVFGRTHCTPRAAGRNCSVRIIGFARRESNRLTIVDAPERDVCRVTTDGNGQPPRYFSGSGPPEFSLSQVMLRMYQRPTRLTSERN